MIESDFKDFFQKLANKAYTRSDLRTVLVTANSLLASNFGDSNLKNQLFISSIDLAKKDIELYVRIMNSCIENSLYCMNYLFLHSSIFLIDQKYAGDISLIYKNHPRIFYNLISIILKNEILDEIDIIDSCDPELVFGKDPRINVPYKMLTQFEDKIFEILNKKYTQKLIDSEYDLESDDLDTYITKLDIVYTTFGKCISFTSENYCYSKDNSQKHFRNLFSPLEYDEKMRDRGVLLFPRISEINIIDNKVIISNNGFGNLCNCTFTILYQENKEILHNENFGILSRNNYPAYIDTIKKKLLELPGHHHLEFRFDFKKFNRKYFFLFIKRIGPIADELKNSGDFSVSYYDMRNYGKIGNMAIDSKDVKQSVVTMDFQELRDIFNELANLIDESDIEIQNKDEVKTNINEGIKETYNEKMSFSKIAKISENLIKLIDPVSKAYPVAVKVKDFVWNYIQNNM
ncbi:hypothetical protein MSBR3_0343 [Methanosarcina barkeri 3]|uniref:Uncharacterized protein n=1 Tax=Methanosarcina barkeri 3 TaxID=1434107 RepID=A0A0E3SI41_METBA|nr:hypothetical protein [Methanosarcina barkeri]AKB80921.1 hypothetical protein MSBR3_0343 [Methanosarcina barkeri 3]